MIQRSGNIERRKSKGSDLYQRVGGAYYQSLSINERGTSGRHSRVSPSPGRGITIAYSPCPSSDPRAINLAGNVLAIPLSAIETSTTSTAVTNASAAAGWLQFFLSLPFVSLIVIFLSLFFCFFGLWLLRTHNLTRFL